MPPLAPRPFQQLARRCWKLKLDIPRGYMPGITGAPWYRRQQRRALFAGRAPRRIRTVQLRPVCEVFYHLVEAA